MHGYRNGHQLLSSSVRLGIEDQDAVDYLSDLSGSLRPGERFGAYISAYPLPSGEYFAMAKTKQDMLAPRSGCVLTRTLLLPMDYWCDTASPTSIARILDDGIGHRALRVRNNVEYPPVVSSKNPIIEELVEALFLEKRQAIVVFEPADADAIALRILAALWPVMRGSFSVCTYALAPRTLLGRPFDLVFAPKSVQARFARWEGRRIDGARTHVADRNRWAYVLAERVLQNQKPHLVSAESACVFGSDGDDTADRRLRLALLWEVLREQVDRSPKAVLGLIDIANSIPSESHAWTILQPIVAQCIHAAAHSLGTTASWDFFATLVRKLEQTIDTIDSVVLGRALFSAARELARRDWKTALASVIVETRFDIGYGIDIVRGVSATISIDSTVEMTRALGAIPSYRLLPVALLTDDLLERMFLITDPDADAELIRNLTDGIRNLASDILNRAMVRLLRLIRGDQHVAVLGAILSHATAAGRVVLAVRVVWHRASCRTPTVGEVLCAAAETSGCRHEARRAFVGVSSDEQTERCVARLLKLEECDVEWLLEDSRLSGRRERLLVGLIDGASDSDLERVLAGEQRTASVVRLFVRDLRRYWRAALRVVDLPGITARDYIEFGLRILDVASGAARKTLAHSLTVRILTDLALRRADVQKLTVEMIATDVDIASVLDAVFALDSGGRQVTRALAAFEQLDPVIYEAILGHVKRVIKLVARRRDFDLSLEGSAALARLIERTKQRDPHTYLELCSLILPYAMASRRRPASQIVVVTFPALYDELRGGRSISWFGDVFEFLDWDRCKVARNELVRAFMESNWPPADLGITAYRAGDLKRILKRVLKSAKGLAYVDRIERGVKRIECEGGETILLSINEIRRGRE